MNEGLYNAVFCYGENQIDPFEMCCVDFDQIMLEQLDVLLKAKAKIIEATMDMDNRDEYCREKYGLPEKEAWQPTHFIR